MASGLSSQLWPSANAAAVDYFLKIEGVDGESKDDKHKGWIELESYSFGVTNSGVMASGGGGGAGKAKFNEFTMTKLVDKSSPILMLETATGKHFKSAEIVLVRSGTEIMKWKLSDVLISSYQNTGSTDLPMEQISLNFAKIEVEYGSVKAGWDIKTNKRV
jgi:type VI secretion system secreted protein Hcp